MCYYFSITSGLKEIENYYDFVPSLIDNYSNKKILKAFDFPKIPIITSRGILYAKWGLIPYWVEGTDKAKEYRRYTFNARMEDIHKKISYREAIINKRCIIPCNSFYEYHYEKEKKILYKITLFPKKIFSLAGVYDEWIDNRSGKIYRSFSIITTKANDLMAEVHNNKKRMPVILPKREDELLYISNSQMYIIKELLNSYNYDGLQANPFTDEKL